MSWSCERAVAVAFDPQRLAVTGDLVRVAGVSTAGRSPARIREPNARTTDGR
jgi:hypothetical protein